MPVAGSKSRERGAIVCADIVLERYRDSEALIEHAAHLGDLAEAFLATASVSGELLGEPSADLRANPAGRPARLFTPFLSM